MRFSSNSTNHRPNLPTFKFVFLIEQISVMLCLWSCNNLVNRKTVSFSNNWNEIISVESFGKVEETKFLRLFETCRAFGFLFFSSGKSRLAFWAICDYAWINSYERANCPLSDSAKQNSVRSIVFELWFFAFFVFFLKINIFHWS